MDPHRHCEELVREADKDRFLASLFAPADRRGALHALYAFDIEIARVRNVAREPLPGELRLQWWRDVLTGERRGEGTASPVGAALLDTIECFSLRVDPLLELLEARSFDLYDDPMPSLAHLEGYARQTTSPVIALAAQVLGAAANVEAAAVSAGVAIGLTRMLRDLARHASRGQLYLPADLLARHAVEPANILAGQTTPELHAALAELRLHVRRDLETFDAALPTLPASAIPTVLPVALVPLTLARMERPDYDPFRTDVEVPQWRRQWAMWRAARRMGRVTRG
jgi:15-cis-phytoene synthase